jgi:antitoxin VapB
MALSIKSGEADRLAREVARLTGESLTEAVTTSLRERLERERRRRGKRRAMADRLRALARECASLPDLEPTSPDEIIGYDEHGAPR